MNTFIEKLSTWHDKICRWILLDKTHQTFLYVMVLVFSCIFLILSTILYPFQIISLVAIASLTVVVITLVVVWKNLRYLTGNLYFESPVEISFVPKHIREFLGLCSIEGGEGKYPKEIIIPTDKLPLDKECEIILYIKAKEKVSVRMIEVGFEGGHKAEIPEILGLSNGIVKEWIKEIPREIFITHWGWINVIFTIPKRLQKEEQGELFVGINVKIKKSGIYYLNVRVTSEEAEKYKFERLKVVVK